VIEVSSEIPNEWEREWQIKGEWNLQLKMPSSGLLFVNNSQQRSLKEMCIEQWRELGYHYAKHNSYRVLQSKWEF
jgi:hypothetical protein